MRATVQIGTNPVHGLGLRVALEALAYMGAIALVFVVSAALA